MKTAVLKSSALLLLVAMVFCFTSVCAQAQEKVINLKFSNVYGPAHRNGMLAEQWSREVEKRTNGRVKIAYFAGGTLSPGAQIYDSTVRGISDIGASVLSYTRGKFPMTEMLDLPLGMKSGYLATKLINEYYKKFKPKEFDDVKVLFLHAHGPGLLHTTKKPVYKLEDVKGMKIRSSGINSKIVQALGGAPVGMPIPETYDALMKGVAEGVMVPIEALKGWKLGEVTNYTTLDYGSCYSSGMFYVMNKSKWNALPNDIKAIIEKINEEWIEKQAKLWDEIDKEGRDMVLARGNKFITLSKEEDDRWAARVKPILEQHVKEMQAKGLPGDEALKFCQEYIRTHQK
jgi:TRAP-type C4-dicarboxylate transport system substrate-binding protein